jgi:NAD(P)-dependent dehydrogenase (short-subunit alcohol dehydrogenase family)
MRGLQDRVAIVTGMTGPIGTAIARRLVEEGAAVVGTGRRISEGVAIAGDIDAGKGVAKFVGMDLTSEAEVLRAVESAYEWRGRLDIIVNNAAATDVIRSAQASTVVDESTEAFKRFIDVGVLGLFWLCKFGIPHLITAGDGAIVNISSMSGSRGVFSQAGYSASKGAVDALTRQMACDFGCHGVRVNSIVVGSVRKPGMRSLDHEPTVGPALRNLRMLDRTGTPDDVAGMVAFLASTESGFTTGASFPVDGGVSAKLALPDLEKYREQRRATG